MICEIIKEPKNAKGITHLGRYLVGASRSAPALGWERLSAYVLAQENERGEIVENVRTANCLETEIGRAVAEMAQANARCTTSTAPRVYHFVISLSPGESLTPSQFAMAEQRYVDALGLTECKRISATHLSKEHIHRHVAVATASAPDRKNRNPRHSYTKTMIVSAELERHFGLKRTNHERGTGRAVAGSFLEYAREYGPELLRARSWSELHHAAGEARLFVKPRGAGLVIGSLDNANLTAKASQVSRGLSAKALEDRLGPFAPDAVQRESKIEYTGAFADYVKYRNEAKALYKSDYDRLREKQQDYTSRLTAFYAKRIADERKLSKGRVLHANLKTIIGQSKAAQLARREQQKREREIAKAGHSIMTYAQWRAGQIAEKTVAREAKQRDRMELRMPDGRAVTIEKGLER